jgi:hypothetical protein
MGLIWQGVCAVCYGLKECYQVNGRWICGPCRAAGR